MRSPFGGSFILAHSHGCAAAFPGIVLVPDSEQETHNIHVRHDGMVVKGPVPWAVGRFPVRSTNQELASRLPLHEPLEASLDGHRRTDVNLRG